MEPIIFTEDQFPNIEAIGAALFSDEKDPRSSAYVRIHIRPKINWFRVIGYLALPILAVAAFVLCVQSCNFSTWKVVLLSAAIVVVYFLLTLKAAVICAVKIYQRFAPEAVRNKCRFEPSCSQYMILAIKKYGLWTGMRKGRNRLKRCNIDGGGFDDP